MPRKTKNQSKHPWQAFLERRSFQWFLLALFSVAAVVVIFISNDDFKRDFNRYSDFSLLWREDVFRPVRVTVDYGGGKKRAFQGNITEPLSAAVAIQASAKAGKFSLHFDMRGNITDVDGVRPRGQETWFWYLNGVLQSRPVQDVVVRNGDQILLAYHTK